MCFEDEFEAAAVSVPSLLEVSMRKSRLKLQKKMFFSTFLPNIFLARFHFRFNRSSGTGDSNVIFLKIYFIFQLKSVWPFRLY